jgi:hypothetical protein
MSVSPFKELGAISALIISVPSSFLSERVPQMRSLPTPVTRSGNRSTWNLAIGGFWPKRRMCRRTSLCKRLSLNSRL